MSRHIAKALLVVVAIVVSGGCKKHEQPVPTSEPQGSAGSAGSAGSVPVAPPPMDRAALLEGKMPEGTPEVELINAQCRICHTTEYLTQQRLSEAAWNKTIAKMKKLGANVTDADIPVLAKFAATYWNPDLPPRTGWKLVPPPAGALPLADK